jgi:hypothetical protein
MHFITSNFNNLHSNRGWDLLKKKYNVILDEDYNSFYIKLNNRTILNTYDSFHIFIYLDVNNIDKNIKLLKELKKKIFLEKKLFCIYIFKYNDNNLINNKNIIKKISNFIAELNLHKKNLYLKSYLELKHNFFNERNKSYLKFPFDISALKKFSAIVRNNLRIIYSKPYKLIILDCDNTLWGGILDEDKAEGISYGNDEGGVVFKEFQNILKKLKKEGFLLSISSKNNEKSVWAAMKHKKMILQKKDFLNPKINWDEKYINIKKTLSELSLRPSDSIFIDDNILEIEKVKKFIKGINCLHINKKINIKKNITDDPRFQKLIILEEDIKKYKQYEIKFKYEKLKKNNKNNSIFFKKLKQKIKIFNCNKSNFERALQLFAKTNQFNFSLNRYGGLKLKKIINDLNYDVKLFDLNDKFGSHGIIGAYIIKKKSNTIEIIDFILSCRVFNRYVEDYIIWHICKTYKARKILINYLSTDLNNKLIPKFLKNKYFVLKNKINNVYTYQVILNKNLNEIKNIFNNQN